MIPVYAAVIAAALAIASAIFTVNRQQRATTLKDRQQLYAAIMGKKHLRNQVLVSRFEAKIFSDCHQQRWILAGTPPNSLDLQEAQRWMHKSEELVLELARTNQSLFENLGAVRTAFILTPELSQLTAKLYDFKTLVIASPPEDADAQTLHKWQAEAVKQLQAHVEKEYGSPVDALLLYLEKNMMTDL